MYNNDHFRKMLPLIKRLPEDVHFDMSGGNKLQLQASTQAKVDTITEALPGDWTNEWSSFCKWWQYCVTIEGTEVRIIAVEEAPPGWTKVMESEEVLVGYKKDGELVKVKRP